MIRCFWCGTANPREEIFCAECKRELRWSRFLGAVLRPTAGSLLKSTGGPIKMGARQWGAPARS